MDRLARANSKMASFSLSYDVVSAGSAIELAQAVNALIAEGWRPLGGMAALPFQAARSERWEGGGHSWSAVPERFMQAMTREVDGAWAAHGGAGDMARPSQ